LTRFSLQIWRSVCPHQLILRKTDASYRRRVVQRQQDLDDRAMLSGEPPAP